MTRRKTLCREREFHVWPEPKRTLVPNSNLAECVTECRDCSMVRTEVRSADLTKLYSTNYAYRDRRDKS